jgi:hypothetical protein
MALRRTKVHRNVEAKQRLLGLEVADGAALTAVFAITSAINRRGVFWNLALVGVTYLSIRVFKRGKPDGYLGALSRFYGRPPFYSAGAADRQLVARPFLPSNEMSSRTDHAKQGVTTCSRTVRS